MDFQESDEHADLRSAVGAIARSFGGDCYAKHAAARREQKMTPAPGRKTRDTMLLIVQRLSGLQEAEYLLDDQQRRPCGPAGSPDGSTAALRRGVG